MPGNHQLPDCRRQPPLLPLPLPRRIYPARLGHLASIHHHPQAMVGHMCRRDRVTRRTRRRRRCRIPRRSRRGMRRHSRSPRIANRNLPFSPRPRLPHRLEWSLILAIPPDRTKDMLRAICRPQCHQPMPPLVQRPTPMLCHEPPVAHGWTLPFGGRSPPNQRCRAILAASHSNPPASAP